MIRKKYGIRLIISRSVIKGWDVCFLTLHSCTKSDRSMQKPSSGAEIIPTKLSATV